MKKQVFSLILIGAFAGTTLYADDPCCLPRTCCTTRDDSSFSTDNEVAKTHFTVQPHYTSVSPQHLTGFRDRTRARHDLGIWGALQGVVFGGKTTCRNSQDWGRYFSPCNTCDIVVSNGSLGVVEFDECVIAPGTTKGVPADITLSEFGGGPLFNANKYDVLGTHFLGVGGTENEIVNQYETRIKIIPEQRVIGGAISWRHAIAADEDRGSWYEVVLPIVHVRNCVTLLETNDLGLMVAAFQRDAVPADFSVSGKRLRNELCHGQITHCCTRDCDCECQYNDNCCRNCTEFSSTALANAELKIWYDFLRGDVCSYGMNVGFIFPTTDKQPTMRQLFPPIAGHRHFGIQWGHSFGYRFDTHGTWQYSLALDMRSAYLFKRTECRSFDLCNKPWSRYMLFWKQEELAPDTGTDNDLIPGICCLTFPAEVTPRLFHEGNIGFIVDHNEFQFEAGMHLLCRQSEKIKLCGTKDPTCGIANPVADGFLTPDGGHQTESSATIKHIGPVVRPEPSAACGDFDADGPVFIPVRLCDINLNSAAHPSSISYQLYGAINYRLDDLNYPSSFGIGGSYSFGPDNTTAHRWSLWVKTAVSF